MWTSFEWRSKVKHQLAQRGAEGPSHNVTPSVGPSAPTSELNAISCRNGGLLFRNAEEKFVTLFLTSGLNFFVIWVLWKVFFFVYSEGRLCHAVASSHSSLLQRLGRGKPLGAPQCPTATRSHRACMTKADGFIHWKARSLQEASYGLSEQGHRRTRLYMASAAKFYVCFCVVRVMLLLSFIRPFAV